MSGGKCHSCRAPILSSHTTCPRCGTTQLGGLTSTQTVSLSTVQVETKSSSQIGNLTSSQVASPPAYDRLAASPSPSPISRSIRAVGPESKLNGEVKVRFNNGIPIVDANFSASTFADMDHAVRSLNIAKEMLP